jgi:hypothetical protein
MESKRGQVTLFVIIAIAIVIVALISFLIYKQTKTENVTNLGEIESYIQEDLNSKILQNIFLVSYQGGYAIAPDNSFENPYYRVAYWIEGNKTDHPSIEEISTNIDVLNSLMPKTNLSGIFPNYQITSGELSSITTLRENSTVVQISWPITIKKGDLSKNIETFNFEYDIRLKKAYSAAVYIADYIANDTLPNQLPPEINLTIYNYQNASLYEITEANPNFIINNQPLMFVFASK